MSRRARLRRIRRAVELLPSERRRRIEAMVEAKRVEHPSLRAGPVTSAALERAALAENIELARRPIREPGRSMGFGGFYAITLRETLRGRHVVRWLAHELAHVWLGHFDVAGDEGRATGEGRVALQLEAEAEYAAELMRASANETSPRRPAAF